MRKDRLTFASRSGSMWAVVVELMLPSWHSSAIGHRPEQVGFVDRELIVGFNRVGNGLRTVLVHDHVSGPNRRF